MIAYLHGKLIWAEPNAIILSINGLGYEVNYVNEFSISDYGIEFDLFTTHKISEYGQTLFGFRKIEEKIIFEELNNIKGIGSKVVFTIMSALKITSWSDLQNTKLDDLVKITGVGKSTAQKLLLGISTKLKKDFDINGDISKQDSKTFEKKYNEVINMLEEWGIKKKILVEFFANHDSELADKSTEKIIEFTLKNLK